MFLTWTPECWCIKSILFSVKPQTSHCSSFTQTPARPNISFANTTLARIHRTDDVIWCLYGIGACLYMAWVLSLWLTLSIWISEHLLQSFTVTRQHCADRHHRMTDVKVGEGSLKLPLICCWLQLIHCDLYCTVPIFHNGFQCQCCSLTVIHQSKKERKKEMN